MTTAEFKDLFIAVLLAPLSTSLLFGLIALLDAPDDLGFLIAGAGMVIFYGMALMVTLTVFVPLHLAFGPGKFTVSNHALLGCVLSVALFVAFSVFTGDFGPAREWIQVPVYGGVLGLCFAVLAQRGNLRD